ncbi:hypothetical protein M422DRAFT_164685, partial [Sphaerobolus stellatus SS14]
VIGVFHCMACTRGQLSWQEIPILWVHWFGLADPGIHNTVNTCSLDCISLLTAHDGTEVFGFVDPAHVIRACQLIPAFARGQTQDLLPADSVGRGLQGEDLNYNHHYVNSSVLLCQML